MSNAREFTIRLADLLRREHAAMAEFLVALAAFDRARLWLELGHPSLFYYLHRELGLSKGAAFYRKTAAELVQRFPEIVEPLRDGRICITSVVHLSKILTPENREEMLPRFFHRSRREAMELAAAIRPSEVVPRREVVTAVRAGPADAAIEAVTLAASGPVAPAVHPVEPAVDRAHAPVHPAEPVVDPAHALVHPTEPAADRAHAALHPTEPPPYLAQPRSPVHAAAALPSLPSPPRPPVRDTAEPITAELSRLHVTVSRRFLAKLEAARDALSHASPGATAEEILEAGLDLVLERRARRNGIVANPRKEPPPTRSDRVPAHVRRAVWKRDGGRCQWPTQGGGVCGSTLRVEFDHVVPRARGGPATAENGRILCALHNQLSARLAFGDGWMNRFTRRPPARETARACGE